jgi:hypothetical protein
MIGRYAAYYTNRLNNIEDGPIEAVKEFLAGMDDFLNVDCDSTAKWGGYCPAPSATPWAIHDHMLPVICTGSAECHPCCMPQDATFDGVLYEGLRPDTCDPNVDWATECAASSPYGPNGYPWMYDSTYENPFNGFYSFREIIGKDDQHQEFYKDTSLTPPLWNPNRIPQNPHAGVDEDFYLEDATNYYIPPYFAPDVPEIYKGIFPFFYKMNDWGVTLPNPITNPFDFLERPRECHWCDPLYYPGCPVCDLQFDGPHPHPLALPQLSLPLDPSTLVYNTTGVVDGYNINPGFPPLWVDKVDKPSDIISEPDLCAENFYGTPNGFWKPGDDQFCSDVWPYSVDCAKNQGNCQGSPFTCGCGENGVSPTEFPDDALDSITTGLKDFITWAEETLALGNENLYSVTANLSVWYPEAARWIEPAGMSVYDGDPEPGFLVKTLTEMTEMRDRVYGWIVNRDAATGVNEGYVGATCTEVWCVTPNDTLPGVAGCSQVRGDEVLTFNSGTGVYGDVPSIINCLDHNINTEGAGDFNNGLGNANRWDNCFIGCEACRTDVTGAICVDGDRVNQACGALPGFYPPRSLVDGFDNHDSRCPSPLSFWRTGPVHTAEITELRKCPALCTTCFTDCSDARITCQTACSTAQSDCSDVCASDASSCSSTCASDYGTCFTACAGDAVCEAGCASTESTCNSGCSSDESDCNGVCDADLIVCNDTCDADLLVCNDDCTCEGMTVCAQAPSQCNVYCGGGGCACAVPLPLDCQTEVCNDPTPGAIPTVPAGCLTDVTAGTVIATRVQEAKGICEFNDPDTWLDYVARSIPEATNQVAKFELRKSFLEDRYAEAMDLIDNVLNPSIEKFEAFLSGPAQVLINARVNLNPDDQGLPYQAVYGWSDEAAEDGTPGKWHIVKAEARVLDYCDNRCAPDQVSPDPRWPRIRTYTKNWGMRRCYELDSELGSVKFRVTRYDEDRDSGYFNFPNGVPIWNFITAHPKRPQDPLYSPGGLSGACAGSVITTFRDGSPTGGIYDGAFMVDEHDDDPGCWNLAHRMLTRGVVTETCARYSWMGGRMNFLFVPCQPF